MFFEKYECTYFIGNIEMTLYTWGRGTTKANALRRAKRFAHAIMQKKSTKFSLAIPSASASL